MPGGARDSHGTFGDAAIREADEEAGVGHHDLTVRLTMVTAESASGWTYTTVIADVAEPVATVANGESTELRWVRTGEVQSLPLHPGFARRWPALRDRLTALP